MSSAAANLVAVAEHVPRAGAVVWWRLSGDTSCDELQDEWVARGLSEKLLPSMPSPTAALSRAISSLRDHRTLVRPLAHSEGRAVVIERPNDADSLDYQVDLRAKVDAVGRPTFDPPDHPSVGLVRGRFDLCMQRHDQHTIGSWLVKMVERCDGVRLRDTGGVYFVPEYELETWNKFVGAVHAASAHRINAIPALRGEDAVASVLDALENEANEAAAELEEELASPELTPKKASTRAARVERLTEKVTRYEALLAERAPRVAERLERLHGALVAASLVGEEIAP